MKRILTRMLIGLALMMAASAACAEETLQFGRFGTVHIYAPEGRPQQVAIFVSGDGGWELGVIDMSRLLTKEGALVIGVDIRSYLKSLANSRESCSYAAADFEALSQYVQKKLGLGDYHSPLLVGYSSGATLVYGTLAQAPANTFAGAISLGFCPDLPLKQPFCKGPGGLQSKSRAPHKGFDFVPSDRLPAPWGILQGEIDQTCDIGVAMEFSKQTNTGRVVALPHVGHGFGVQKHWVPQFRALYRQLTESRQQQPAAESVADLPLVEVPATREDPSLPMAVLLSGDGGWAGIDREVAQALAAKGMPVIGLNSLRYFWSAKQPAQLGSDLDRIIAAYREKWHRDKVVLIGYSFGADVAPFAFNHLNDKRRPDIDGMVLIGVSPKASFEFRLGHWLGSDEGEYPVLPELKKVGLPVFCIYGSSEGDDLCPQLTKPEFPTVTGLMLPGGHHMGGDYALIADKIIRFVFASRGAVADR